MKTSIKTYIFILTLILSTQFSLAESNFSGDRLNNALVNYINKLINQENNKDIEVILGKKIQDYHFSQDDIQAKFDVNPKLLRGSTFIAIEFFKNDVLVKRDEYPVRIKQYALVPIANRIIKRNEEINENDISFEKRDISIYQNGEILDINDIIGNIANQNISKNTIISSNNIKQALQIGISRGDIVNVISRSGAVAVSVKGTALNDAELGKQIRVKCDSSKSRSPHVIIGIVESPGIVAINN